MAINFDKFKGASAQKSLEAQATTPRETQGGGDVGYGIFDLSKAPYTINAWKPKVGKNTVLILPVEVTNRQNPAISSGAIGIGDYDYGVSITTHMGKGTNAGLSHVCLKSIHGKKTKCPRCEEFFATYEKGVQGSGNPDHASSERNYFLVVPFSDDGKAPDEDGMGLWNAPANSRTGFPVVERAKEMADGAAIVPFWWPTDEGRLVQFDATQAGKWLEFKTIKFLRRDTKLAASLAEKYSFPLDSMLIVKTAGQIEWDMFGDPALPGEQGEPGSTRNPPHISEEDKEPEMDPDAFGAPERDVTPETIVESEMSEPEPVKAEATATGASQCPYGHTFGKDWGDHKGDTGCKACKRDHKATEALCAEAA